MARKLKSDKVLFLATLLLVCASVVMVYSASAALAMNRFNQPYFFLVKQAMWAALGLAAMSIAMRFDYRNYREPSVHLDVARAGRASRWSPSCSARRSTAAGDGSASAASASSRRSWRSSAPSSSLPPCSSGGCIASTTSRTRSFRSALVVGALVGLILLEPDLGTAMTLLLIAVAMVFTAGLSYRYIVGAHALRAARLCYFVLMSAAYRRRRLHGVLGSRGAIRLATDSR